VDLPRGLSLRETELQRHSIQSANENAAANRAAAVSPEDPGSALREGQAGIGAHNAIRGSGADLKMGVVEIHVGKITSPASGEDAGSPRSSW